MLKALCSVCPDLADMSEEKKEGLGHLCTTLQVYLGEENHDLSQLPPGLDPISLLARVSVLSLSSAADRGRALRSHAALWMESASCRAHTVPLGYHPVLTLPAVNPNPCCYFLSFLLITGNKLFMEAKLSHFLFKVDFQDPKNSPKSFSSMESLSRITSRITTFLTIHIPRGPSHNVLPFPSWAPEVHANVLVYLQMCQCECLFGFLWEKIWFACLPPVTLCCNCEHVEWKMRFRVNTVIFSSGLLVNTEGVAHLARDKQMPVACEHKHLFYMRDSQRPSFSYKASKTQMWIW